jgi:hypoxanthine phosphoribosyltransferase
MKQITVNNKPFELFLSSELIQEKVNELGLTLSKSLKDKNPLFLGILNGCFMFASDLFKQITIDAQITFLKLASYQGSKSTGSVKQLIGLNQSITGQHIVILEDIVDTGITLEHILNQLSGYKPASIQIVTLLFKPESYLKKIPIDYIGFEIPNDFIVGYGLDFDGYGRNSKDIYKIVKQS